MPLEGESEGEVEGEGDMMVVDTELDGCRCWGPAAARPIACPRGRGASWEGIESPGASARSRSGGVVVQGGAVVFGISELQPKCECKAPASERGLGLYMQR